LEPHAVAKFLANMFPDRTLHAVGNGWSLLDCTSLQIAQHNHSVLTSADNLLALAEQAWKRGEASPVEHALPVYLRGVSAWKKARGKK
ncbi:MAG: tRNA (adenosine(37)-N6)-threonylcarbamoyltransferase complex dimerization subunit type 1 TsaB, partial [Pseudomonadales bacterium]